MNFLRDCNISPQKNKETFASCVNFNPNHKWSSVGDFNFDQLVQSGINFHQQNEFTTSSHSRSFLKTIFFTVFLMFYTFQSLRGFSCKFSLVIAWLNLQLSPISPRFSSWMLLHSFCITQNNHFHEKVLDIFWLSWRLPILELLTI